MSTTSSSSIEPPKAAKDPVFDEENWTILDEGTQVSRKRFFDKCVQHLEKCRHTICKNESIITEIIDDLPKIYDIATAGISRCTSCMRVYYNVIKKIKSDPPERLMARGVLDQLLAKLGKLDQDRVAKQVERAMDDQNLVGKLLSEVLFYPQVLACDAVLDRLTKLLLFLFEDGDLNFPGLPPGLFFFLFHENGVIRQWAETHIDEAKLQQEPTDATETDGEDDDATPQIHIPLTHMRFVIDYIADWLRQIVATELKNGPTLAPLTQLISVASDDFWKSLFRLLVELSEKDLHEIFPSVFTQESSSEEPSEKHPHANFLNDILSLLPQLRKYTLALELVEVLLARLESPHTFWSKSKLMPVSVLKLISRDFERAKVSEDHRRWFDLLEAVALSIQYAFNRCSLLDPTVTEIFRFTVVQVQESASASMDTKLQAAYIFARAFEAWRKNPLSYQRTQSDGPEPSVEFRANWASRLIFYIITQNPIITPEKRFFVGRVVATQLSNDAARISDAVITLLNSLNKLVVRPSLARSSSSNLSSPKQLPAPGQVDPIQLRVLPLKDLWYNATACCENLNEPVHAAILTAFRDLALLDLEYCGGLNLSSAPPAWQATCEHLKNVLIQFRSFQKTYFGLAHTTKTRLPYSAFSSAIFSLLALAPDLSPENSQISAGFKACLRAFCPQQNPTTPLATVLHSLLGGPEGVDLVRGLKLLFSNLAVKSSAKFSFFSWHWACQYFLQLLTQPEDSTKLFKEKLETMERLELNALKRDGSDMVPFFETWWIFIRYAMKFGTEHASAPHSKLESTMPILFDLVAIIFKNCCEEGNHLHISLTKHSIWYSDLMRWSISSQLIRKKWLEAVIEVVKQLKVFNIPVEPLFVNSLREVIKDASHGDARLLLATLIPADGIGNLGLAHPLADLPSRFVGSGPGAARIQSKLSFSPVSTMKRPILVVDDDDDDVIIENERFSQSSAVKRTPVSQSQNQKLDFWFSSITPEEAIKSIAPKIEQRNAQTLAILRSPVDSMAGFKMAQKNKASVTASAKRLTPSFAPRKPPPPPAALPAPRPSVPPPKSITAEDRMRELELQRAEGFIPSKRNTRVLVEDPDSQRFGKENDEIVKRRHRKLMAPSVDDLLKKIISWSLNTINSSNSPPDRELSPSELKGIPSKFQDIDHYAETFQPLLLMEFWGQLKQAAEEDATSQVSVSMRMVPAGTQSQGSFDVFVFGRTEHGLQVNDLVVVTPEAADGKKAEAPSGQQTMHALAKIEKMGLEGKDFPASLHIKCKFFLPSEQERLRMMKSILRSNKVSSFQIKRLANMATMLREYQALMRFMNMAKAPNNVFVQSVLVPSAVKPASRILQNEPVLLRHFEDDPTFNQEQLGAIREAVLSTGYTLIQGPPGTGKTRTIVALIASLLDEFHLPILVCAPSNAAVDEIVSRLLDGIPTVRKNPDRLQDPSNDDYLSHPTTFKPKVVRVVVGQAATKKIRADIEDVTLERLIQKKIDQENRQYDNDRTLELEREVMEEVADSMRDKSLPARPREVQLPPRGKARVDERARRKALKNSIIAGAQVVCATLSTSGRKMIRENWFQSVIIDEAAQAVEISTIIPLTDRARRVVMVGDPNQLPATVLSKEAKSLQYEQSLFARMMKNGFPTRMLTIQYRMHPEIREFPSQHFYDGRLLDGPQDRTRDWHSLPIFGPFVFFDLQVGSQRGGRSLSNPEEARFISRLLDVLRETYQPKTNEQESSWSKLIGVITPYQEQRSLLANSLSQFPGMDIGTVDGFQGREKDIIVLSTVRSHQNGIGFLADVRRLNVALTRAKSSLWIIGNSLALSQNPHWKSLMDFAREQDGRYYSVSNIENFLGAWRDGVDGSRTPPRPSARVQQRTTQSSSTIDNNSNNRAPTVPYSRRSILPAVSAAAADAETSKKRKADPDSIVAYPPRYDDMDIDIDDMPAIEAPPPKRSKVSDAPPTASSSSSAYQRPVQQSKPPQAPTVSRDQSRTTTPKPSSSSSHTPKPSVARELPRPRDSPKMPPLRPSSAAPTPSQPRFSAKDVAPVAEDKPPERIPPPPTRKLLPVSGPKTAVALTPKAAAGAPKKASTNVLGSIIASMSKPS